MRPGSRIVVDTNVFVSRVLSWDSIPSQALGIVENHHILLTSYAIMEELAEVLLRPKFAAYITDDQSAGFLARLNNISEFVSIIHHITACRDPKDDKFLDVAVGGDAHCIITGDADLLALHPFRGIVVLTPADFIRSHETGGEGSNPAAKLTGTP
jgi:putative PIN family toxin of toxin-antitoxin system